MNVLRSEIHIINKNHRLFKYCDDMCFRSKNLYNYANYIIRQEFINNNKFISAFDLNKRLKNEDIFKALPAKTSQQTIIRLGQDWKSFFRGIKGWSKNKEKYLGKPNMPKYKNKNGRFVVFFDYMQGTLKNGIYKFPKTKEYIDTQVTKEQFRQIQIIPFGSCYKISVIYRKEVPPQIHKHNDKYLGIDLGLNNLATLTNNIGIPPIIINGKILKSVNNYYNKEMAKAMSYVGTKTSKRMQRLSLKRNNIINTQMHKISRWIINYCVAYEITTIVIGNNDNWKQKKKRMQRFIYIPYEKLIQQIKYKAEDVGINVTIIDERYTSKSSFIDNDPLPSKFGDYNFSGKRIKRGLYRSRDGTLINADVNGSYNILRKCNPKFSYDRIKGVSLHPTRLNIA